MYAQIVRENLASVDTVDSAYMLITFHAFICSAILPIILIIGRHKLRTLVECICLAQLQQRLNAYKETFNICCYCRARKHISTAIVNTPRRKSGTNNASKTSTCIRNGSTTPTPVKPHRPKVAEKRKKSKNTCADSTTPVNRNRPRM
jgi:hypothetical protein